jgi:N-acetyl-anhydromuramyl-L-alanine amidase AmpD
MNIINSNLKFKSLSNYGNIPEMVVLHHADAVDCSIEDIHQWHLENGWSGCGYHYLVKKNGSIYAGRPEAAIGAHCLGYNEKAIGICTEGNFNIENMGEAQYNALKELISNLLKKYNIHKVRGHRELCSTDCPGKNFPLDRIKNDLSHGTSSSTSIQTSSSNWTITPTSTNSQNTNPKVSHPYPGYMMKMNPRAYNNNVKLFQQKLINLGYNLGNFGADGYFGKYTFDAVLAFQRHNGLLVDGIVGINTWTKLFL